MLPADDTYSNNYIDMFRNNNNSNRVLFILLQALHYYGETRMMMNIVTG